MNRRLPPLTRRPRTLWGGLGLAVMVGGLSFAPRRGAATVAEQRARLPPPARCHDPVAGTWRSHEYDRMHADWTIFSLEIERVEGSDTALTGTIENHTWYGDAAESEPGVCKGLLRYYVSMDSMGTISDGYIHFGGIGNWRLDDVPCGRFTMGYNLDNFSGRIDPDLQEFQSVNNDGGRAVNDPTVFRRVKCAENDEAQRPHLVMKPPPFFPPEDETEKGGGCAVW